MEADKQVAQQKKEKAGVERQLEVAIRRIVELEEQLIGANYPNAWFCLPLLWVRAVRIMSRINSTASNR